PALTAWLDAERQRHGLDWLQWHAGATFPVTSGATSGATSGTTSDTTSGTHESSEATDPTAASARTATAASTRAPGPRPIPGADLAVLDAATVARLAPALRGQVSVPLLPTRNAAPTARRQEDRALVAEARWPVHDATGRMLGMLHGGVLLNRNLRFIDALNDRIYPPDALPFGSRGTATLFLGDVRVSTNVRLFGGEARERAIGTRVSQQVHDAVLRDGRTWLQRAFVVDDWYVSAYRPLHDARGQRIGMLYVGFLERPFIWLKWTLLGALAAVLGLAMWGAGWLALRASAAFSAPLERMAHTMREVEAGHGTARVGPLAQTDEIGTLARHLDHLLDTVDAKTRDLQRWNAELDAQVAARTRALEQAQAGLVRRERLATIGQLTAGIAHEVNNPIAVIQGNLDLVRALLPPPAAAQVRTELALVDEQIARIQRIITQLLQFARPGEAAATAAQPLDVTALVDDSLRLVAHLTVPGRLVITRDLRSRRIALGNRLELQQVLVNLLVNALQAMDGQGELTLRSGDEDDGRIAVQVGDSGPGLGPAVLAELFQPFRTHKHDGNGLGLWISRGIVERHGGELTAADREDGRPGAVFTLRLQARAPG
ncbi:MAG: hypothetical protein RL223_4011, partial [Pseudomonadota bacterium]